MTEQTTWSWQTQVRTRIFGFVKSGDLPPTQAFILLRLMEYANWADGREARPGVDRLAKDARVTERTVSSALRFAREFGLIEETYHGGGSGDNAKASEFRFLAANLAPATEPNDPAGRSWPIKPLPADDMADEPLGVSADATADPTHEATYEATAVPPSKPSNHSEPDSTDTGFSNSLLSTGRGGEQEESLPRASSVSGSRTERGDGSTPPRQHRLDAVDDRRRPSVTMSEVRRKIQRTIDRRQQRYGGDEEPEDDESDD